MDVGREGGAPASKVTIVLAYLDIGLSRNLERSAKSVIHFLRQVNCSRVSLMASSRMLSDVFPL